MRRPCEARPPFARGRCPDAVTSAATRHFGGSEALTHDQAHGVTMRGSLRPGLAQGNAGAAVLCSAIVRPPSCPAFPRGGFASQPSHGLGHQGRSGTMRALTPGALAHARQVSPLSRLAVRTSHPQTRGALRHPFRSHTQGAGWTLRPRLRHHCAGSPLHAAESGSSSCGLPVRLRLLSTPPRGDAVTFGYMCRDIHMGWTCTSLTKATSQSHAIGLAPDWHPTC